MAIKKMVSKTELLENPKSASVEETDDFEAAEADELFVDLESNDL